MPREKVIPVPTFGYLSTLESPEYGHFGGNLILSPLGRPLEFHCTSPVRPSRAQEILYGPTLQSYLIGEQIGGALLKAARLCPCLILVDGAAMLAARSVASAPMALVLSRAQAATASTDRRDDESAEVMAFADSGRVGPMSSFGAQVEAAGYSLILPSGFECDKQAVAQLATQLSQHVDLAEPFGRIHEAIREAQRISGRTAAAHGQAA
jgi:hypothetical protein